MIAGLKTDTSATNKSEQSKEKLKSIRAAGKPINWDLFSFERTRELLKDVKGSFSDLLIEEREIR